MKHLLKLYLVIILFFLFIFLVMNLTGLLSVEDIVSYVNALTRQQKEVAFWVILILLASDVFFSVPTVFLVTAAGWLLGFKLGLVSTVTGMFLSGLIARIICRYVGGKLVRLVLGSDSQVADVHRLFQRFGPGILTVARALPMLPEATSCLAGVTRMPFWKWALYYLLGTVPYAVILVYFGSVSSRANPYPALLAIAGMYVLLWTVWWLLVKRKKDNSAG